MKLGKKKAILLIVLLIVGALLFVIPVVVKNYINNNGKELIGRKVNITSLKINYFSGEITTEHFLIYEENGVDTFVYVANLYINPGVFSCIQQNYVVEDVKITGLKCNTTLKDSTFNFDSFLNHFSDTTTTENEDTTSVHYTIEQFSLKNSFISYQDLNLKSEITISQLNTTIPDGIHWNNPQLEIFTDFNFESGGSIDSEFNFNIENGKYGLKLNSTEFNLNVLLPYMKDVMAVKNFEGYLTTNLSVNGNINQSADVDIAGSIGLGKVSLEDTMNVKVVGLENLAIYIDSLNPARDLYELRAIKMDHPYCCYEVDADNDNFSRLFELTDSTEIVVEEESNSNVFVMIKDYVAEALDGIKASNFSIDTVAFNNIDLLYTDHAMIQKFEYTISEINMTAYNVKSNADSLIVNLNGLLNEKGILKAEGILHPKKPEDVHLKLSIDQLVMKDLSPYFYQYVAFPVTKGTFDMNCDLTVRDKKLQSNNDLLLKSFKLGRKQKHSEAINLPLKLGVAMLKNREGHIPLNIPVEGDLADPKYKVWKTVGKIVTELLLKAATSPYKLIAGGLSTDEGSTKRITLDNSLDSLSTKHYAKLDNLSKVLNEKRELALLIDPYYSLKKESEKMSFFLAKADFLKVENQEDYSKSQLQRIYNLEESDSLFVNFINSKIPEEKKNLTIHEKTDLLYDESLLKEKVKHHIDKKLNQMYVYLISKGVEDRQLKHNNDEETPDHDNTSTKNLQYQLMFDVLDEELD